jgi:iron complex transport system substrate-binding protein
MDYYPKRIVCLTEETTEWLYLLGEEARIVGISRFTVRPPRARREKPRVSTFLDADIEAIRNLEPDLVIGFSDIQATIAQRLIQEGIPVWVNNQRSVRGILEMMVLGDGIGCTLLLSWCCAWRDMSV